MKALNGQVAIVTGAGTGIGRATALALAAEGATVVLSGRRLEPLEETARLIKAAGSDSPAGVVVQADVTDPDDVARFTTMARSITGSIDILVNNAGLNVPRRALATVTWEDWQRIVHINLNGCFLCAQAVLPDMRARQRGTLVHVGSGSARKASPLAGAAYSAAKAGLLQLSNVINVEERKHGIRSCVITLGDTATDILDLRPEPPPAEVRARILQPEDVATTILMAVTLPMRATIEEIILVPTYL
jgi:NAD(P)-dependent dehydrogenase (short-subunit alcohol dehydrogenase family)